MRIITEAINSIPYGKERKLKIVNLPDIDYGDESEVLKYVNGLILRQEGRPK